MVRSILSILRYSLGVCVDQESSANTTSAESTESRQAVHITTRCFMVLCFWIVLFTLIATALLYSSPRLLKLLGVWVSLSLRG